jgi:hypothetical protein
VLVMEGAMSLCFVANVIAILGVFKHLLDPMTPRFFDTNRHLSKRLAKYVWRWGYL